MLQDAILTEEQKKIRFRKVLKKVKQSMEYNKQMFIVFHEQSYKSNHLISNTTNTFHGREMNIILI